MGILSREWFARPATEVAQNLIGCQLVRRIDGATARGTIVEVEAYEAGDPATHGYRNITPRNAVMFGPAGFIYVYLIYGIYHCFNIVTDEDGFPSAVLIRAVEFDAHPSWIELKKRAGLTRLAAGPGKLCRALDIDTALRGKALGRDTGVWVNGRSSTFEAEIQADPKSIVESTRIGLSQGIDTPWRWYLANSPAVSQQ